MHNFYLRKPAPLGNWVTQVTVTISMPPWSPLQLSCLMPGEWGSLLHTGGALVRLHLLGEVVPGPWTSLKGDTATRPPLLFFCLWLLIYFTPKLLNRGSLWLNVVSRGEKKSCHGTWYTPDQIALGFVYQAHEFPVAASKISMVCKTPELL